MSDNGGLDVYRGVSLLNNKPWSAVVPIVSNVIYIHAFKHYCKTKQNVINHGPAFPSLGMYVYKVLTKRSGRFHQSRTSRISYSRAGSSRRSSVLYLWSLDRWTVVTNAHDVPVIGTNAYGRSVGRARDDGRSV